MKKIFLVFALFLVLFNVHALDTNLKIYDFNQSITPRQEKILKEKIDKYREKYNIDVILVTVKYYEAKKTEDYVKEFYKKNKFGKENNNNVIIFVLDYKNEPKLEIFTVGIANNIYTEIEKYEIEESINLEKRSYDIFDSLIKKTQNRMKNSNDWSKYIVFKKLYKKDYFVILILSFSLSSILIIILLLRSKIRKYKKEEYKEVNFHITKSIDKFLNTHTDAYRFGTKKGRY